MASYSVLASNGAIARRPFADSTVLFDYCAMTKPEVNCLIAITTATAFFIGSPEALSVFPWIRLLHAVFGTVLVASGAATLNQWMEYRFDAEMRRTSRRPVAAGRIEPVNARRFGTVLSVAGIVYLTVAAGPLASGLAAATLLSYLFLYTPLKRRSPLCTAIGAIPGAVSTVDWLGGGARKSGLGRVGPLCDCVPVAVSTLHGHRMDVSRRLRPRRLRRAPSRPRKGPFRGIANALATPGSSRLEPVSPPRR
jgi:protoheme IX farnesyltransferase